MLQKKRTLLKKISPRPAIGRKYTAVIPQALILRRSGAAHLKVLIVLQGPPVYAPGEAQREEREYDTLHQNVEALLEKPREAEPQRQRNNELE